MNKVELVGRLGRDPELRYTQNGSPVCNLSMATSEYHKDKQTGESKELTEWHRIVVWGSRAEKLAQLAKKGDEVFVMGKIQTRKGKDEKYYTDINADVIGLTIVADSQQKADQARDPFNPPRQSTPPPPTPSQNNMGW